MSTSLQIIVDNPPGDAPDQETPRNGDETSLTVNKAPAKAKGGRTYVKKTMEEKNSNKGWADGLRSEVLQKYLPRFKTAWFGSSREAALEEVMRDCTQEYLFQFPGDVLDVSESQPDPVILKPYDAKAEYPLARLSPDKERERQLRIKAKRKQIREWLRYRVTRVTSATSGTDQLSVVGEKLVGLHKPRKQLQGYQQWQVENRPLLNAEVQEAWQRKIDDKDDTTKIGDRMPVSYRQAIARRMFGQLDEEAQKAYVQRAIASAEKERREYEEARNNAPIRSPETVQSAINNLPTFLTPILENVQKHTGLMMVVYAFGPMPSEKGELSCITVCSGKNLEATPVSFVKKDPQAVRAHRARLLKFAAGAFTKADMDAARLAGGGAIQSHVFVDEVQEEGDHAEKTLPARLPPSAKDFGKKKGPSTKKRAEVAGEGVPDKGSDDCEGDSDEEDFDEEDFDGMDVDNEEDEEAGRLSKRQREGDMSEVDEEDSPPARKKPILSEYERVREANIARNKAILDALGLDKESTAQALGFPAPAPKKKKTSARKENNNPDAPVRRSTRQGGTLPLPTVAGILAGEAASTIPSVSSSTDPTPSVDSTLAHDTTHPCPHDAMPASPSRDATPASPAHDDTPAPPVRDASPARDDTPAPPAHDAGLADSTSEEDVTSIFEEAMLAEAQAPDWITGPLYFFRNEVDLGEEWKTLLANWVLLENEAEFMRPLHYLPKGRGRPKMLGNWIVDGRLTRTKTMPYLDIASVPDFVAEYESWWEDLQPKWRKCDGKGWNRPKYRGKDLGVLNTRGQNGWLSIVACLWWWGVAILSAGDKEGLDVWENRLGDAIWMLELVRVRGEREC